GRLSRLEGGARVAWCSHAGAGGAARPDDGPQAGTGPRRAGSGRDAHRARRRPLDDERGAARGARRAAGVLRLRLQLRGFRVRLASFLLLQPPHLGEAPVRRDELAEVAALDDLAVVEDEDLVGIDDRREAVRDDERGAVARDLGELRLNGLLRV